MQSLLVRWRALSRRTRKIALIVSAAILVSLLVFVAFWSFRQSPETTSPTVGGTVATSRLLTITKSLRDSFGRTPDRYDSARGTTQYLAAMQDIQRECDTLSGYFTAAKTARPDSATTQYLAKSTALCHDLTGVVRDSVSTTTVLKPLLTSSAHAQRYQTLPLIRDSIRSTHIKQVAAVSQQLPAVMKNLQHPNAQLPEQVLRLQQTLTASRDLSYFPALAQFQMDVYSERQRYWNNDADLGNLINTLDVYLGRYCRILPDDQAGLSVCKDKL